MSICHTISNYSMQNKMCLFCKFIGAQKKERLAGGLPTALIKLATSRTLATLTPLLPSADALLSSAFLCAFAISFCIFSVAFARFSSNFLYINVISNIRKIKLENIILPRIIRLL